MQLKIQRSQRTGGVLGNTIIFCLDVRADYSPEEQDNIRKYRLGPQIIYNSQAARKHIDQAGAQLERTQSRDLKEQFTGLARGAFSMAMAKMSLNISIASLGRGHHIECKDLEELLEAEDTVREACKGVTRYLQAAATFDSSETVIDYENGEERVHITQHAPPLLSYQPTGDEASSAIVETNEPPPSAAAEDALRDMGKDFRRLGDMCKARWLTFETKVLAYAAAKNWKITELHVRTVGGVAVLVLFILILQIL